MASNPVILTLVTWYLPGFKGGGAAKSVHNLVLALGDEFEFRIITHDRDLGDRVGYSDVESNAWNEGEKSTVFYAAPGLQAIRACIRSIRSGSFDVLYLNSFFSLTFGFIPLLAARSVNKPVVLCPRGQLSAGALSIRPRRKQALIRLFRWLKLSRGVVWQASSDIEAKEIRAVVDPDAEVRVAVDVASRQFATALPAKALSVLRLVFISRIAPKKNLDEAIAMLSSIDKTVELDIYGPIEDEGYWQRCKNDIEGLPSNVTARYRGVLLPSEVVDTLSEYDLFFFPTLGENFGHVIAEAFCAGLPALISDRTPWRDLQNSGIGWDLPLEEPARFTEVIRTAAEASPAQHRELRERVLDWARAHFSADPSVADNKALLEYAATGNGRL